jgi:F-type H+-transporting ATPase subunit beta
MLDPQIVGERHYKVARGVQETLQRTRTCRTSSPSSAWTSSREDDRLTVDRARKIQRFLSQPFFVAQQFTGSPASW